LGRVAQRESTPFTREGSHVQSMPRPPSIPPNTQHCGLPVRLGTYPQPPISLRFIKTAVLTLRESLLGVRVLGNAPFTDYYEILEISPNARQETIERIFRHHARRYHPDNQDTGDFARFNEIVEAHDALKDPVKRAQYDIQHQNRSNIHRTLAEEASDPRGIERDADIQGKVLSILYVKCRRSIDDPGFGNVELERLSGIPREHLEFHLWYLKQKGWIRTLDNGQIAITVEGIDRVNVEQQPKSIIKLLKDRTGAGRGSQGAAG
jgi:DnaJ-domain-containing protein 1